MWERIIDPEFKLAEAQGIRDARKEGVVLLLSRQGVVLKRGIGLPPWKVLLADVKAAKKQ